MHPAFYRGPAMVKPPIVYIAGLLRARRRGIESDWSWMADMAGQRLFRPPNVSGWNDARWLDTSTFRGRWTAANEVAGYDAIDDEASYNATETPKAAVRKARQVLGQPAAQPPDDQDPGALRGRRRGRRHHQADAAMSSSVSYWLSYVCSLLAVACGECGSVSRLPPSACSGWEKRM